MNKTFFLLMVLLSFNVAVFAQDSVLIDSLKKQLISHNAARQELGESAPAMYDTTAANILFQLSKSFFSNSPDTAIKYAEQSLAVAAEIDYKKGMARAYNILGAINNGKGKYKEALELYKINLKIREEIGDKKGVASSYNNIGVIYDDLGNYPEALKHYFAALKILDEIGDKGGAAACYNNIGIIYDGIGNYPQALKNYFISLKIRNEIEDKEGVASSFINIGVVYKAQGNYPEALKHYTASLKTYEEIGDLKGIANSYNNIGNINYRQADYPEALKNYFAALKIKTEIGDKQGLVETGNNIGITFIKQKKYSEASQYLNKARALANEIGNLNLIKDTYLGLAELDSAQSNFKQALEHYKLFISTRDSLVNNENTQKIAQQQMQFDFDKKQEADSLMFVRDKEIGEIKLQKQKAFTFVGFLGIAVTILLLFFVYRNYHKQRIANQKLKEAQDQLIKSEKMAAFGVMASRVSHEIQNPLNFVNNFSELSQELVDDVIKSVNQEEKKHSADMLIANLQKINEQGKKAADIVKQLQEHTLKGTAQEFFDSD